MGCVLGVAVNLFGAAYLVVLEFVGGLEANNGIVDKTLLSPPAIGGAFLCGLAGTVLLTHLHTESTMQSADTQPEPADPLEPPRPGTKP